MIPLESPLGEIFRFFSCVFVFVYFVTIKNKKGIEITPHTLLEFMTFYGQIRYI